MSRRILFVENRTKTRLWLAIARFIADAGHRVHWIVQNPVFRPRRAHVTTLPFPPPGHDSPAPPTHVVSRVCTSDRNINHFGGDASHYGWYWARILEVVDTLHPEVIFGEATLFHELLTIEAARLRGIPYLNPTSNRYPPGRTSFYLYDSLEPVGGGGEEVSPEQARRWVEAIGRFEDRPSYMVAPTSRLRRLSTAASVHRDRALAGLGWVRGERFNTPSPTVKRILERRRRAHLVRWDSLAVALQDDPRFSGTALYPMHVQPESSLDVWGRDHRDQAALVGAVLESLPDDWRLLVKANPKPKYELQGELLSLARALPGRLVFLERSTPMRVVLPRVDLLVTVTGTAGIEANLGDTPVVTLAPQMINDFPQTRMLDDPAQLHDVVVAGEPAPAIPLNDLEDRIRLINRLVRTSYPGHVIDPTRQALDRENLQLLVDAFLDVIDLLEPGGRS